MSFTALGPFNIPRMPSRPERPLPYQKPPGAWDAFAESAGGALGESLKGQVSNHLQNSALKKALGLVNENQSPLEQYMALSEADPQARAEVMPFLSAERKAQRDREQTFGLKQYEHNLNVERDAAKHEQDKALEQHKHNVSHAPDQGKIDNGLRAWNSQLGLIKDKNLGNPITTGGVFNRTRQRQMGQFTSNNSAFEQLYVKKINPTGALSDERFKYIMKQILPQIDLSDEENIGRLIAIADEFGFDKSQIPEVEGIGRATAGKTLSDVASKITDYGKQPAAPVERSAAKAGPQKFMVNQDTGELYVSNGTTWQKVNQ